MPKFDYRAAKAAGATDDQIVVFLQDQRAKGRDVSISRTEMTAGAGGETPPGVTPAEQPRSVDWRARVLAGLPAAGAVGGAALASPLGPLGIAGGGAAGAVAGRFLEQRGRKSIGYEPSQGFLGQLTGVEPQGLIGETMDLGGEALLGAAGGIPEILTKGAAGSLMRAAVPETKAATRAAMNRTSAGRAALPTTAETLAETRIPANRIALRNARNASGKELQNILTQANKAGFEADPGEFARGAIDVMEQAGGYPLGREARAKVLQLTEKFLGDHPDMLDAVALKALKKNFQDLAKKAYASEAKGGGLVDLETRFNEAIARQARRALETIPGVGARESATQALLRAERGVQEAELRGPVRPAGAFGGGLNLPVASAVGIPREALSRVALAASSPAASSTLRVTPRLIDVLIREGLISPDEIQGP